jgi:hypothetical protein
METNIARMLLPLSFLGAALFFLAAFPPNANRNATWEARSAELDYRAPVTNWWLQAQK